MFTASNQLINGENLKKMLALQETLNVKYNGEDWRDRVTMGYAKFAMLDEVSELLREIESTWKWWKHDPTYNRQKAVYELIDLLHFALLAMLHRFDLEDLNTHIDKMGDSCIATQFGPFDSKEGYQQFFVDMMTAFVAGVDNQYLGRYDVIYMFNNLVQAGGELVGVTDPVEIYSAYVMKNHRNHERVDGGVMVGKYDKSKESDLPIGK